MDWLHCNQCYRREGIAFVVTSCGHIVCEGCVNPKQCTVCGASCNYLHISDKVVIVSPTCPFLRDVLNLLKMKPQEQAYFSDPVKLIHSRLEHISQVALFQKRQKEKITAYFKQKSVDLEKRLKEAKEQSNREVSDLRRENAELKKPLSQRRASVGNFQTSSSNRMSRPVAITPPVTPGLRLPSTIGTGSGMSLERYGDQHPGIVTTPGSVTSVSSLHSLRDPGLWTPISSIGTAHRTDPATPNFFRFGAGSAFLSPIPRNNQHSGTAWIQN